MAFHRRHATNQPQAKSRHKTAALASLEQVSASLLIGPTLGTILGEPRPASPRPRLTKSH